MDQRGAMNCLNDTTKNCDRLVKRIAIAKRFLSILSISPRHQSCYCIFLQSSLLSSSGTPLLSASSSSGSSRSSRLRLLSSIGRTHRDEAISELAAKLGMQTITTNKEARGNEEMKTNEAVPSAAPVAASRLPYTAPGVLADSIDPFCPLRTPAHVHRSIDGPMDACLTLQNEEGRQVCILQLLESNTAPLQYWVWARWSEINFIQIHSTKEVAFTHRCHPLIHIDCFVLHYTNFPGVVISSRVAISSNPLTAASFQPVMSFIDNSTQRREFTGM